MAKKKHPLIYLLISIVSFVGLLALSFFTSPNSAVPIGLFSLQLLYVFLFILFVFVFSLITYIFYSKTHGVLIGLFIVTYLFLRTQSLTQPFYLILLIALTVTLEFFFSYKK